MVAQLGQGVRGLEGSWAQGGPMDGLWIVGRAWLVGDVSLRSLRWIAYYIMHG